MKKLQLTEMNGIKIYLLLLIAIGAAEEIFISAGPKILVRYVAQPETLLRSLQFIRASAMVFLDATATIVTLLIMPIAFVYFLKRKNWARLTIIYSCVLKMGLLIYEMVLACNFLLKPIPDEMKNFESLLCFDFETLKSFTPMIMVLFFVTIFAFSLPIYALTRPKIKEQFK